MFLSYSQASHSCSWVLNELLLSFCFSIQCRSSILLELRCPSHLAKFPLEKMCISGWPSIPLSLTPAFLPESISFCSSALLPTWSFNPGVQPRPCTVGKVLSGFHYFGMKCSVSQLHTRHSLCMKLDVCNRGTSKIFVRYLQWESHLCSWVPSIFST